MILQLCLNHDRQPFESKNRKLIQRSQTHAGSLFAPLVGFSTVDLRLPYNSRLTGVEEFNNGYCRNQNSVS